ncbi:reverse transcriptase domain-containing protein [Tanacetum coccineum]
MVPTTTSLTGFNGETIWPLGQLRLLVTIGYVDHSTKAWMNFMIVRSLSSYNGIIGRPGIREIQGVPSTAHGMLKFPADGGIVTIRSTILIPAECAMVITSSKEIPKEAGVRHENFKVALHLNFPDQEVAIGGTLSTKGKTKLCLLLKKNLDIFAWQPSDMIGVSRSIAEHRLNIREGYSLVEKPDENGSDAGLILTSPEGTEFTYALRFQFTASNNKVEYEAQITGLRIATQMGVRNVHVRVDSKLVANQVLGAYVAKEENMIKYLEKVLVEILKENSIQEEEVTTVVEEDGPTWMTPIIEYLKEGTLPDDKGGKKALHQGQTV